MPPGSAAQGDPLERLLENARSDGLAGGEIETLWSRVGPAIAVGAGVGVAGAGAGASASASGGAGAGAGAAAGTASAASASGIAGASVGTGIAGVGAKTFVALLVGGSLAAAGATQAYRATHPPAPAPIQVSIEEGSRAPTARPAMPLDTQAAAPSPPAVEVGSLPVAGQPARISAKGHGSPALDHSLSRRFPDDDLAPSDGVSGGGATGSVSPAGQGGSAQRGSASPGAPLPNEGAILLRARQQLGTDPGAALALTDEHARRFPSGSLTQEREVLAIEALTRLGRTSDARARLAAFRDRFPQSPHISRLEALTSR